MRVALLSTLDSETPPGGVRAPFRRFAGSRIIERQLDLALAAGCETIACLTDNVGREVIELQHRAERSGVRFIALRETHGLSGIVSADSELLVFAPGVLPADASVLKHVTKPAVLVFPADLAVPRGYERIDPEFAWAGVFLARGAIVERLRELPPDADAPSALLRIALQSGTRPIPLEKRLLEEGEWHLRPEPQELAEREEKWIHSHARLAPFNAPGLAVSERMGIRLARDILGGKGTRIPAIASGVAGVLAVAVSLVGFPVVGLGFGALMAIFAAMAEVVERVGLAGQVRPERSAMTKAVDWLADPVLVVLVALASPEDTEWLRLFVPVMLFGLLRLGRSSAIRKWRMTYADRVAAALLILPAALFGLAQPVAASLALLVLLSFFITIGSEE